MSSSDTFSSLSVHRRAQLLRIHVLATPSILYDPVQFSRCETAVNELPVGSFAWDMLVQALAAVKMFQMFPLPTAESLAGGTYTETYRMFLSTLTLLIRQTHDSEKGSVP